MATRIQLQQGAEHDVVTARTFPLILAAIGTITSAILLLRPAPARRERSEVPLGWRRAALLAALVLGYALGVRAVGFFLAGTLFLGCGFWLLGERSWRRLALLPIAITAGLQVVLHGLLDIYLEDPVLRALGLIQ